jgi:hypothetical protein
VNFLDLHKAATVARQDGWCALTGSVEDVRSAGLRFGWREVPNRASGPSVSVLRPTSQTAATPRSLSAIYGLDRQPLHTDGAHIRHPPDIVVLVASGPTAVPTLVRRIFRSAGRTQVWPPHLDDGVFLVQSGRDSFYTTARIDRGVRFDPGCMTPCDQRARLLSDYFVHLSDDAEEHQWTAANQVLVVDNRRTVHARAAADSPDDQDRTLNRISFLTQSTP